MNICHAYLFFSIRFAGGTSDLMFKICKAQEKLGHKPIVYSGHYEFDHDLAKLQIQNFALFGLIWINLASIMPSLKKNLDGRKIT